MQILRLVISLGHKLLQITGGLTLQLQILRQQAEMLADDFEVSIIFNNLSELQEVRFDSL